MAEYINREELINNRPEGRNQKQIGKEEYNRGWNDCRSAFYALIEDMPAANVAPVRHGRWLFVDTDTDQFFLRNRCKIKEYRERNYCPNCGAKMDGGCGNGEI